MKKILIILTIYFLWLNAFSQRAHNKEQKIPSGCSVITISKGDRVFFGGNDQPFIWLLIYCIPLSMILTWLYYRSKKSIIPVMLLHAGTNVVFRYFPIETKVLDAVGDEFTLIKTIVYMLFAVILLIVTRGSLGYVKQISNHG